MFEVVTQKPKKLALPAEYREMVNMAPVLANEGKSIRYTLNLANGLNVLVDTYADERLEFRVMPEKETRYIRIHKTNNVNDPKSYVCKVRNPLEFVRMLGRFVNIPREKVQQLDYNAGLRVEDERLAFLRPFLSTEPIYSTNGAVKYIFEFPNGFTPVVRANGNGTFNLMVLVNNGRGPVDFFDLGTGLWRQKGIKKLIAIDNEFTMVVLYKIFGLPKHEVRDSVMEEVSKEALADLEENIEKGTMGKVKGVEGILKERMDNALGDILCG